jgi:hypothetical protein
MSWQVERAPWGSEELRKLLNAGWEPFAVTLGAQPWVYVRRQAGRRERG